MLKHFLRLLLFCNVSAFPLIAQVDRASVTGSVFDPSRALIGGASVEITNVDTNGSQRATTSESGAYTIVGLPLGHYAVKVSAAGFKTVQFNEVRLQVGETRKIDVVLQIATQESVLEVTDTAVTVEETSGKQGIVVTDNELRNIPVNGRDWSSYMLLAPGAVDSGGGSQRSIRVMGRSKDDNNFVFDGVDATGVKEGPHLTALRTVISNDAISEFKVTTGMYTAETGYGIGAQVSLVSKTGTNDFHGGVFHFLRNDAFDARRFIDGPQPPPFRMNQFGGNLGGPLDKNKTFFFVNYEGLRQVLSRTFVGFVPSADFRDRVLASSPTLKTVIDRFPLGTTSTNNSAIDQVNSVLKEDWHENSGMARIDHRVSDSFTLYARYNAAQGLVSSPRSIFGDRQRSYLSAHNAVIQFQNILTPASVNEFKVGFNRSNPIRSNTGYFESISVSGFSTIPGASGNSDPGNSYSLIDNLAHTRGRHSLKMGAEIRWLQVNISQTASYGLGYTTQNSFLLNRADSLSSVGEFGTRGVRTRVHMFYFQDDWKIRPNLTVNLGVRYEIYTPLTEAHGRARTFDISCGGICAPGTALYNYDKNNIGPRVSFAWNPSRFKGKTTIRGGAGIYHMQGQVDDLLGPIESDNVRLSATINEIPTLSFPMEQFLSRANILGETPRAIQRKDRSDFESYQGSLFVVQELPGRFVFQAGGVFNLGRHLLERNWTNFIDPATGQRPLPTFGQVDIKYTGNNSNHAGLQVSLNRPFTKGWMWGTQYSWSHTIDENGPGSNEGSTPQDPRCRACDRASSGNDVRHVVTLSSVYELPFGKNHRFLRNRIASAFFGDWELSGISTARTGLPVNVTVSRSAGDIPTGNSAQQRPDLVPGVPLYPAVQTANNWMNIAAFAIPAKGKFGTLGRNTLRGPGLFQLDVALTRRIPLGEAMALSFRAEAFNLTNRNQLSRPNANISAPGDFGRITSTVNTGATGSGTSRQLQFMLRVDF